MNERQPNNLQEPGPTRRGRTILDRVRRETNDDFGYFAPAWDGEDVFHSLYLTARATAIPEHLLGHDIHMDVRALHSQVFNGIRDELVEESGRRPIWVVVDPALEDHTISVICTDESLLLIHWSRAWQFSWPDEEAMAEELSRWYAGAAGRLPRDVAAKPDYGGSHNACRGLRQ